MNIELGAAAIFGGIWALRQIAHRSIVRGLRAPRVPHAPMDDAFGLNAAQVQQVLIPTMGGKHLVAWMVSPPQAATTPAPAVLVMHGWGAHASLMWSVVPPLHSAGFTVLLLDARCHGNSDDETFTSMPRFAEDIAAGLAWFRLQPHIATDRVALLGHSVGAGAALLHAAHHNDVSAVVSLSAFAHPGEVMRRFMTEKRIPYGPLGWYVMRHVQRVIGVGFDEIAPLATLPAVRCPILLVHGLRDSTVPVEDAYRLRASSNNAHLLLVEADHDLRGAIAPYSQTLVSFLQRAFEPARDAQMTGAD